MRATVPLTDVRFLLPFSPRGATVVGNDDGWREALTRVGLEVGGGPADLAVAPASRWRDAIGTGARALALQGVPSERELRAAGFAARRVLVLPELSDPALLLPLDAPAAVRYALREWAAPGRRIKRLRNRLAVPALARGMSPPGRPPLTIAVRAGEDGEPFPVRAARGAGVDAGDQLFVVAGESDALSRGAMHLFAAGDRAPSWVLKFARLPGLDDPFDRDERGLRLAAEAGGPVAAHAPRLVARLQADGLTASVETAAVGRRLIAFLSSTARRSSKVAAVERIAAWVLDVARHTLQPPEAAASELVRLREQVVPRWVGARPAEALERVGSPPAVLQHNDLGSWNIVIGDGDFTALDWESARAAGLPLWDLWYLLGYATAELEAGGDPDSQRAHLIRLFRGEARSSPLLFEWTRRAVRELGIRADSVGALATLCWLHHGLSHASRVESLEARAAGVGSVFSPVLADVARGWLEDPLLGPEWDAWRA